MHNQAVELATIMIARKFKEELPNKFWNKAKYKPEFQHQMRLALKLLKNYDYEIIMLAVFEMKWCYSLAVKKLVSEIHRYQELKDTKPSKEFKPAKTEVTYRKNNKEENIKDG
jgi:hypothetical protein